MCNSTSCMARACALRQGLPRVEISVSKGGIHALPEHGQCIAAPVPAADGPRAGDEFDPCHALFKGCVRPARSHSRADYDAAAPRVCWVGQSACDPLTQRRSAGLTN